MEGSLKERLLDALAKHWPLLLSAGLVMVELRRIRCQLTLIGDELARGNQEGHSSGSSRRLRRASTSGSVLSLIKFLN